MEFWGDDRGVSGVIGAVLVLGFLVLLLSLYQASYVPAENEQIEFAHSQQAQNDMLEIRNAILSSDTSGETTYSSIKLGTRYPARVIGINPPPASGVLRTGEPQPVTITDGGGSPVSNLCPATGAINTRTLEYEADYSEYQNAPTLVYENTVLYLDFGERTIPLTGQQLVRGDTITVRPLNTSLYETGVERISVESVPGNVNDEEVQDAEVTVPTKLSEDTWEELLDGQVDPANVTVTNGNLSIDVSRKVAVACSPVGLNEPPAGGERQAAGLEINPAGPNDVYLQSITKDTNSGNNSVTITLNNTAGQGTNITQARMSFYFNPTDQTNNEIEPYNIRVGGTVSGANLFVRDPMTSLDPDIQLPGNGTQTAVTFDFNDESVRGEDFFVVEFRFENGAKGTYFVDIP